MTEPLTPNERDELASAYLDGELNQDGIVLVEGDPEMLTLVAEHREVQSKVGSPTPEAAAVTRSKHLASALAAFDQLGASDRVVDLTDQREENTNENTNDNTVISLSNRSAGRESRRSRSGMPAWLSAAAASVAVLGGVTYAATQFNGGGDDSGGSADASAQFESQAIATTEAADSDMADAGEAMEEAPMESFALDDENNPAGSAIATEPPNADPAADDGATEDSEDAGARSHDPEIVFPSGFTANDIVLVIGNDGFPIEESQCAFSYEPTDELAKADPVPEPDRFLPVLVGDQAAELFVYGPETAVLVDIATCETIPDTPSE